MVRSYVYFFINVYSACDIRSKRKLWNDLPAVKTKFAGENWIFAGDFNAIKDEGESKGARNSVNISKLRDLMILLIQLI